jgi:HlyD family secretion protein
MKPHFRPGHVLVAVFALCPLVCGRGHARAEVPGFGGPVPVVVARVTTGEVETCIFVTGSIAPIEQVTIRTEVSEQIIMLRLSEGDGVQLGEIVCELNKTDLLISVDEARARLASDRALLEELRAGSRPMEIRIKEAEVAERKAAAEKARLNWKRHKQLLDDDAASQEDVDNAHLDYIAHQARLKRAEASLQLAREGPRKEKIARAEADVRLRQAELDRTEEKLSNATIISPIPGAVSKKLADQYAWVNVGDRILKIVNVSRVKVRINIPGAQRPAVKVMMPVEVLVDPMPRKTFSGALVRINPEADAKTRNFPAQVVIDNPYGLLSPGMFARMRIITGRQANVTLVPADAVVERNRNAFVFVVKDGIARKVMIETGATAAERIQVVKGNVKAGDLVVVRGNDLLHDRTPVVVVEEANGGQ